SIAPEALAGAAAITLLIGLGDRVAVALEDRSTLSPSPALLIAGLSVAGWPLLPLAALAGTLIPQLARRRLARKVLIDAGARCLVVGLIAPVYRLTERPGAPPYSTPTALLGLVVIGAIAYAVRLVVSAGGAERGGLLARWRARLGAMRWYVLAMIPL